jgi:hypothetical protein
MDLLHKPVVKERILSFQEEYNQTAKSFRVPEIGCLLDALKLAWNGFSLLTCVHVCTSIQIRRVVMPSILSNNSLCKLTSQRAFAAGQVGRPPCVGFQANGPPQVVEQLHTPGVERVQPTFSEAATHSEAPLICR